MCYLTFQIKSIQSVEVGVAVARAPFLLPRRVWWVECAGRLKVNTLRCSKYGARYTATPYSDLL